VIKTLTFVYYKGESDHAQEPALLYKRRDVSDSARAISLVGEMVEAELAEILGDGRIGIGSKIVITIEAGA
jgi:hypothetical protein